MSYASDVVAIEQVLRRYYRGIDRLDEDCLQDVWAPDAIVDYGEGEILARTWSHEVLQRLRAWDRTTHLTANTIVDVEGDRAKAETYVVAQHQTDGPPPRWMLVAGRYHDQFIRTGDSWRIENRVYIMDWNETGTSTCALREGPFVRFSNIGTRYPDDRIYR